MVGAYVSSSFDCVEVPLPGSTLLRRRRTSLSGPKEVGRLWGPDPDFETPVLCQFSPKGTLRDGQIGEDALVLWAQ